MTVKKTSRFFFILACYFLLTILFTYPLVCHMGTHIPGKGISDPPLFVWNAWNFKTSLLNSPHDPMTALSLLYPFQPNLVMHTYTILRSVIILFLSLFFNLITSFNIVTLLMFTFSGVGAYFLTLRFVNNPFAAFLSGVIFSFCPFKLARLGGHYNFIDSAFIPFFILLLFQLFKKKGMKKPVMAGILLALVGYCSYYYLVFLILFIIIFFLFYLFPDKGMFAKRKPSQEKGKGRFTIFWILSCILFCLMILYTFFVDKNMVPIIFNIFILVVLSVFLLSVVGAYKISIKNFFSDYVHNISTNLKSHLFTRLFVVFIVFFLVFSPILINLISHKEDYGYRGLRPVSQYPELQDLILPSGISTINSLTLKRSFKLARAASIGIIVFLLSLWSIISYKRNRHVVFWAIIAFLFIVMSLGPWLRLFGRDVVWLPYNLLQSIPFVKGTLQPARFIIMAMLALGILSAYAVHRIYEKMNSHGSSKKKAIILTVILMVLISAEFITVPVNLLDLTPPAFYQKMAQDQERYTVFDLPWRIYGKGRLIGSNIKRAGLIQSYQTTHEKFLLAGNLSYIPDSIKKYYEGNDFIRILTFLQNPKIHPQEKKRMWRIKTQFPVHDFAQLYNIRYFILHKMDFDKYAAFVVRRFLFTNIPTLEVVENNDELLVLKAPPPESNIFLNRNLLAMESNMTLIEGWAESQGDEVQKGRRVVEKKAKLVFPALTEMAHVLCFEASLPPDVENESQRLKIYLNRVFVTEVDIPFVDHEEGRLYEINIPKEKIKKGPNIIEFGFKKVFSSGTAAMFHTVEIRESSE